MLDFSSSMLQLTSSVMVNFLRSRKVASWRRFSRSFSISASTCVGCSPPPPMSPAGCTMNRWNLSSSASGRARTVHEAFWVQVRRQAQHPVPVEEVDCVHARLGHKIHVVWVSSSEVHCTFVFHWQFFVTGRTANEAANERHPFLLNERCKVDG